MDIQKISDAYCDILRDAIDKVKREAKLYEEAAKVGIWGREPDSKPYEQSLHDEVDKAIIALKQKQQELRGEEQRIYVLESNTQWALKAMEGSLNRAKTCFKELKTAIKSAEGSVK